MFNIGWATHEICNFQKKSSISFDIWQYTKYKRQSVTKMDMSVAKQKGRQTGAEHHSVIKYVSIKTVSDSVVLNLLGNERRKKSTIDFLPFSNHYCNCVFVFCACLRASFFTRFRTYGIQLECNAADDKRDSV